MRTPYSGQVLHGQLVQRHVLRLCLEDGSSRESVGLSEGHLERNRWQSELNRALITVCVSLCPAKPHSGRSLARVESLQEGKGGKVSESRRDESLLGGTTERVA